MHSAGNASIVCILRFGPSPVRHHFRPSPWGCPPSSCSQHPCCVQGRRHNLIGVLCGRLGQKLRLGKFNSRLCDLVTRIA